MLQCVAVCCNVLHSQFSSEISWCLVCFIFVFGVLQCSVLQSVAVRCSVLQCVAVFDIVDSAARYHGVWCVAVCCSVSYSQFSSKIYFEHFCVMNYFTADDEESNDNSERQKFSKVSSRLILHSQL